MFEATGYAIEHGVISQEMASFVAKQIDMYKDVQKFSSDGGAPHFGDKQVKNCFALPIFLPCEVLLDQLRPVVESITGKNLYPTYSYARIYYSKAILRPHLDRPSCEYSATLTLRADPVDWPIYIKGFDQQVEKVILPVGSMLVYQGNKLRHWRDEFTGNAHTQVFLHYVDQNGEYSDFKYDHRPALGCKK